MEAARIKFQEMSDQSELTKTKMGQALDNINNRVAQIEKLVGKLDQVSEAEAREIRKEMIDRKVTAGMSSGNGGWSGNKEI